MKLFILTQLLLATTISVSGLNILGIFPYEGKSHFLVFKVYLEELARRGHNVTVISHFPQKTQLKNYHDIDLAGKVLEDSSALKIEKSYLTVLTIGYFLAKVGIDNCENMLANAKVRSLVEKRQEFDVVVVEQFTTDCGLGLAHKLNAPVVGITSGILMPFHYDRFGIPYNPAYVPFHFLDGGTKPSFIEKTAVVIFNALFRGMYHYVQRCNQHALAKYYDDVPPLEELAREIKLVLVYHSFVLTGSRLFPANVIEVGGYHVTKAKPVTGELKKFMDGAEHGVVYISFGSLVRTSTMTAHTVDAILAAIDALPQRFIWKWEDDSLKGTRNNLYIDKWLPQVDILGHPKTLAFLSHAGMGGCTEAIHYGIPMIASPILGDQPSNAEAVEESGLGVILHLADITNITLINTFNKVLDPKFKEKAKQVSKAWHDRPLSPLDTAVFWTEFAARNANITLRTAAADVSFYQYLNLDLVALFLALLALTFFMFKFMFSLCCEKKDAKKPVKSKKSKRE